MSGVAARLTRIASMLLTAVFLLMIVGASVSDLAAATGGRPALVAEVLVAALAACTVVAAVLFLTLAGFERLQRRGAPPDPKPKRPGSLAGVAAALAWAALIASPFLAPDIVAGAWTRAAMQTALVGGVIEAFMVVVLLASVLVGRRKPPR